MTIKNTLSELKFRGINFSTLKEALNYYQLPTARSWENLNEKLTSKTLTKEETNKYSTAIEQIFFDNVHFGDKAIEILQEDKKLSNILANEKTLISFGKEIVKTNFIDTFSIKNLRSLNSFYRYEGHTKSNDNETFYLFFSTKDFITSTEQFDVDSMTDKVSQSRFKGFDHVVAYKKIEYIRVDVVRVSLRNGLIEFLIDTTNQKSLERIKDSLIKLKASFRDLMKVGNKDWNEIQFSPVNIFPKIEEIYSSDQGHLIKLGHNSMSGAINYGKMRGLNGDLKSDPGHLASAKASKPEPFAISRAYPYDKGYAKALLTIPGKSTDASNAVPILTLATIEKCHRESQFLDLLKVIR